MIDRQLPGSGVPLGPDWAVQNPQDYLTVLEAIVPGVLRLARVDPADVIGIGVDFTSCTMLPTRADGTTGAAEACGGRACESMSTCIGSSC